MVSRLKDNTGRYFRRPLAGTGSQGLFFFFNRALSISFSIDHPF